MGRNNTKATSISNKKSVFAMLAEYKRLAPYVSKYKNYYIMAGITLLITDVLTLIIPYLLKVALDGLLLYNYTVSQVGLISLGMVATAIVIMYFRYSWRVYLGRATKMMANDLQNDLFAHVIKLDQSFYSEFYIGNVSSRLMSDVNNIRITLSEGLLGTVDVVVLIGSIMGIIAVFYFDVAWQVLVVFPIIPVFIIFMNPYVRMAFARVKDGYAVVSEKTTEYMSGVSVIQSYNQEHLILGEYSRINKDYLRENIRLTMLNGTFEPFLWAVAAGVMLLHLYIIGQGVIVGTVSIGDFSALMSYISMLIWPIMAIGLVFNFFNNGASSVARVFEVMDYKSKLVELPIDEQLKLQSPVEIELRNVKFSYSDVDMSKEEYDSIVANPHNVAINGISLTIRPNKTLGIVGKLGSGKSTLIKLLARLLDPSTGEVLLNGENIKRYGLSDIRSHIRIVSQRTFLFSGTIEENLSFSTYGDLGGIEFDDIYTTSVTSNFHKDVEKFDYGYKTEVGESGVTLSGGQKQRASIARAMLNDGPDVVILDDSLSAVDTESQSKIIENLIKLRKGKTNVVISHKIAAVMWADEIIVLDGGRISEQGTHDELMALGGYYADAFRIQNET